MKISIPDEPCLEGAREHVSSAYEHAIAAQSELAAALALLNGGGLEEKTDVVTQALLAAQSLRQLVCDAEDVLGEKIDRENAAAART